MERFTGNDIFNAKCLAEIVLHRELKHKRLLQLKDYPYDFRVFFELFIPVIIPIAICVIEILFT